MAYNCYVPLLISQHSSQTKQFLVHVPTTTNVETAGSYRSDYGLSFSSSAHVENNNSTAVHTVTPFDGSRCISGIPLLHARVFGRSTYMPGIEFSHNRAGSIYVPGIECYTSTRCTRHLFSSHSFMWTRTKYKQFVSSRGAPIILYSFVFFHQDAVLVKLARFAATG